MITRNSKIFVAGHNGMVGSAIVRSLKNQGYANVVVKSRSQVNLLDALATRNFFSIEKPDAVIMAAARVGGIQANIAKPAEFLFENLTIQNNTMHSAFECGIKKFVFMGSSCIYPKDCPQPMREEYLLTGKLEPTNEGYALAKIAGLKLLEYYRKQYGMNGISLMPCNLYGTNDSFHPEHSHVLSALVRKFTDAYDNGEANVTMWGTGVARREFMHVDDVAEATVFCLENYDSADFLNIGWGTDVSIKELALIIAEEIGFTGKIIWDSTKPDGMLRKCMDVSRMRSLGYGPKVALATGIKQTIQEYKKIKTSITI
jgi:GDP-L-fucose synthase